LRILFLASEVVPFVKTGGLADVVGSLPKALKKLGHQVAIALPYYRQVKEKGFPAERIAEGLKIPLAGKDLSVNIYQTYQPETEIPTFLVDYPPFFDRQELYTKGGAEFADNAERYALFNRAILEGLPQFNFVPEVLHLNDWHTGLVWPYLQEYYRRKDFYKHISVIFTIHNLGYQGHWSPRVFGKISLPKKYLKKEYLGDDSGWAMIKGGFLCPVVNTVSPKYAREIQTPEFGSGLDRDLRQIKDKLFGVINGIDYNEWNPQTDEFIPSRFSRSDISGKKICRNYLQKELGLPENQQIFLVGVVSRLSPQKGFDIFSKVAEKFLQQEVQLVVLGTGEARYERIFRKLFAKYPQKCAVAITYNNALAHRIYAGCDAFLMPSRYEPCGLSQMIAMAYGTVPVVRATGGLADTVKDFNDAPTGELQKNSATGFSFTEYHYKALYSALERALFTFENKKIWSRLMDNCFAQDFSWDESAKKYAELYTITQEKINKTSP